MQRSGAIIPLRSATGPLANPFNDGAAAKTYLERELKLKLMTDQQTALIEALKTPDTWLKKRNDAIGELTTKLGKQYFDAVTFYADAGYPIDESIAKATEEIKPIYEIGMKHIDVTVPGASLLYTGAMTDNNNWRAIGANQQTALTDKSEYKKYYKERKARHKAKKAAKGTK